MSGGAPELIFLIPGLLRGLRYGGGAELHSLRLAGALLARGYDTRVICYRDGMGLPRWERLSFEDQAFPLYVIPRPRIRGLGVGLLWLFVFLYLLRRLHKPKALQSISVHRYIILFTLAAKLTRARIVCYTIGEDIRILHASSRASLIVRLQVAALNRTDAITALTRDIESVLLEKGVHPDRVVLLPNGLDTARFRPPRDAAERAALRETLGLPQQSWLLGVAARFDPIKRHDLLLNAFHRLLGTGADAYLLLIGDGPRRGELEALALQLGVTGRVIFVGFTSETAVYLRALDAFALVSDHEGHSNALIEAMATGLSIVVTAVGGNIDCIQDEVNGLHVPPNDVDALTEALQRLHSNRALAALLGEAARASAHERYSLDAEAEAYLRLYGVLNAQAVDESG